MTLVVIEEQIRDSSYHLRQCPWFPFKGGNTVKSFQKCILAPSQHALGHTSSQAFLTRIHAICEFMNYSKKFYVHLLEFPTFEASSILEFQKLGILKCSPLLQYLQIRVFRESLELQLFWIVIGHLLLYITA